MMTLNKHALKVLSIILPVFFIGYFLESYRHVSSILGNYFEISTALLPLVMSFSIFVTTWYAYGKSRDSHSLFLGAVFFIIGLLDLYHMLSYPFMPAFITPNSREKSTFFASESMLVSSLLLLASVYVHKNTFRALINKPALFALTTVLSFISLITVLFFPEYLPLMFDPDGNPSSSMIFIQFVTVAVILYAGYLYAGRHKETGEKNIICLIYSFIIFISADIVYISHGYAVHLLKAAGFYFVYLALYKSSVEAPFEEETRAESKLRLAAEERYRNLVDNANDAIITTDLEGRITSWNRSSQKIYGRTEEEVIGTKLSRLIIPPDTQAENELFMHNILLGGEVSGIETMHRQKDGTKIDVSMTVSPLYNANHTIVGLSCIIRDATDRKRAEEISMENMRLGLTIKARSEFLTLMTHDLGTPLNAIIGFSELLRKNIPGKLNKKQERYLDNIIISGRRLLDIINDVLDLGKAETGKIYLTPENIRVPEIMDETANLLKEKAAKHNVVMRKEFDPELEFVEADRQRFKQILFNLLSNAVKYSKPEGGTVTITAKKEMEMAKFSISDTGIGIKEENMAKLFKPFEQLDLGISSKYGSTGLGLVISKKLVELHGGKIMAESKYGEGSTFTFCLPIKSKIKS